MGNDKLDEGDRLVLGELAEGPADADAIATAAPYGREELEDRLDFFVDNGLVRRVDGGYEITDSGQRVLSAPGDMSGDDRIDVPPDVEEALSSLGLRGDCVRTVRGAFAFLRYWGDATASEIRDAVFPERPAEFDDRRRWWTECVEPALRELPQLSPPDSDDAGAFWRYEGRPGVRDGTVDGRRVFRDAEDRRRGSVRYALEDLPLTDDEREAARAAFALLEREDEVDAASLAEEVFSTRAAGRDSADALREEVLEAAFDELPGVVAADGVWRYRPRDFA